VNADEVVKKICRLPLDFHAGSKSMAELVSESGVSAHPEALAVASVVARLNGQPELVDAWLDWSANKRVTSGWYFAQEGSHFVVGFHPNGESLAFDDPALGCAEFVVREVWAVAAIPRKKSRT